MNKSSYSLFQTVDASALGLLLAALYLTTHTIIKRMFFPYITDIEFYSIQDIAIVTLHIS